MEQLAVREALVLHQGGEHAAVGDQRAQGLGLRFGQAQKALQIVQRGADDEFDGEQRHDQQQGLEGGREVLVLVGHLEGRLEWFRISAGAVIRFARRRSS